MRTAQQNHVIDAARADVVASNVPFLLRLDIRDKYNMIAKNVENFLHCTQLKSTEKYISPCMRTWLNISLIEMEAKNLLHIL